MAVSLLDSWTLTSANRNSLGSRTVSAGSDRLLLYAVCEESGSREPTAVTYGGQSMTEAVFNQTDAGFPTSGSIWYLDEAGIAAASGTDFGVTFDQGSHNGEYRAATASYEGVNQLSPIVDSDTSIDNTQGDTTAAANLTLTTENDGFGIWLWIESGNSQTADASWTTVIEQFEFANDLSTYGSVAHTTTDGTNLTALLSGGTSIDKNAQLAITLRPSVLLKILDQPQEADSALAIAAVGTSTVTLGFASETDEAFVVSPVPSGDVGVGQAEETDNAQPMAAVKSVSVGLASESCSATIITEGNSQQAVLLDNWTLVADNSVDAAAGVTFVISAGSNRMLIVAIAEDSSVGKPTSVTYGGQLMTASPRAARGTEFIVTSQFFILNEAGIQAATSSSIEVQGVDIHNGALRVLASSYEDVGQTGFRDTGTADDAGDVAGPITIGSTGRSTSFSLITNGAAGVNFEYTNATEIIEDQSLGVSYSIAEQLTNGADVTFEPFSLDTVNQNALVAVSMKGVAFTPSVGQASETDTAQGIDAPRIVAIGQASEVNLAPSILPETGQSVAVGLSSEADTAQAITPFQPGRVQVDQASETDTAQPLAPSRGVPVSLASETDSAFAATFRREVFVDQARETDSAQRITFVGQETLAALARRNEGGTAMAVAAAEVEAKRQGQLRRAIEREDQELLAILPAIAKSLLNVRG